MLQIVTYSFFSLNFCKSSFMLTAMPLGEGVGRGDVVLTALEAIAAKIPWVWNLWGRDDTLLR